MNGKTDISNTFTADGVFSSAMGALTGGVLLTGFATQVLDAGVMEIAFLAALPLLSQAGLFFEPWLFRMNLDMKLVCVWLAFTSRFLSFSILFIPFLKVLNKAVWLIVVLTLSNMFGGMAGVVWKEWLKKWIPSKNREVYFFQRNIISATSGVIAVLTGGLWITLFEATSQLDKAYIGILFCGILSGFISVYYLWKIPRQSKNKGKEESIHGIFESCFCDRSFLVFLFHGGSWVFATQLAGPFYGVYMIQFLKIQFYEITFLTALATLSSLLMAVLWKYFVSRFDILVIGVFCGFGLSFVSVLWFFAIEGRYLLVILVGHLLSGFFTAGVTLFHWQYISGRYQGNREGVLAIFRGTTGVLGGIGCILGGVLIFFGKKLSLESEGFRLIFLCSGICQMIVFIIGIFCSCTFKKGSASTVAILMRFKNDLNPQTGIGGIMDFIMMEGEKDVNES